HDEQRLPGDCRPIALVVDDLVLLREGLLRGAADDEHVLAVAALRQLAAELLGRGGVGEVAGQNRPEAGGGIEDGVDALPRLAPQLLDEWLDARPIGERTDLHGEARRRRGGKRRGVGEAAPQELRGAAVVDEVVAAVDARERDVVLVAEEPDLDARILDRALRRGRRERVRRARGLRSPRLRLRRDDRRGLRRACGGEEKDERRSLHAKTSASRRGGGETPTPATPLSTEVQVLETET